MKRDTQETAVAGYDGGNMEHGLMYYSKKIAPRIGRNQAFIFFEQYSST